MHPTLIPNLNTLCYNLERDWQFAIIISGDSKVRIGKSMLGQQIAYYIAYKLNRPFDLNNIFFSGKALKEAALKVRGGVFVLDESRADFAAPKTLREETQELIDFFNISGMFNHFIVLILPDFFDLTKTIAIGHTKYLLNCFIKETSAKYNGDDVLEYERGYFDFYGERAKKKLYIYGKKEHNYSAVGHNFWGSFNKYWIVDENEYNQKKYDFIIGFDTKDVPLKKRTQKWFDTRSALLYHLNKIMNVSQVDIINILRTYGIEANQAEISSVINNYQISNIKNLQPSGT